MLPQGLEVDLLGEEYFQRMQVERVESVRREMADGDLDGETGVGSRRRLTGALPKVFQRLLRRLGTAPAPIRTRAGRCSRHLRRHRPRHQMC